MLGGRKLNSLLTTRYPVNHPLLKNLIKYYWVIKSQSPMNVNHKLLPVSNIDFILNFSSPIKYIDVEGKNEIVPKGFHFNGLREKYHLINQTGMLNIFGVSFFQGGLYPFLKTPLSEFTNRSIEIDWLIKGFTSSIEQKLSITNSTSEMIGIIEKELVQFIDIELIAKKEIYEVLKVFNTNTENSNINLLCEEYGINQRKLERIFNKYIGVSPKLYSRINRFQKIINQLEKKKEINLTSLAYENAYYDQTHFIKDFKFFTGTTPTQYLNQNSSVKQIIKYY